MTRTGLVLAYLFHRKGRTWLTLLSVITAFTLFGLLQAVIVVFSSSGDFVGTTRLVTQSRVSFTNSLPMRMVAEIDAMSGGSALEDASPGPEELEVPSGEAPASRGVDFLFKDLNSL